MERELYAALVNGANREGWALWRLPDAPNLPERPADITGGTGDGRWVLLEAKEVDKYTGVGKLKFENSQIRWLRACDRLGGLALVVVRDRSDVLVVRVAGQETVDGPGLLVATTVAYVLRREGGLFVGWKGILRAMDQMARGEREWRGDRDREAAGEGRTSV